MAIDPMPFSEARVARKMLAALFGAKNADAHLVLFELNPARSTSFLSIDTAAGHAAGVTDVWVHAGLTRRAFTGGSRPSAAQIDGLCGFGADIDIADPVHKKPGLPPTRDAAMDVIRSIGLPYSLLVHSGHGFQPWFIFQGEPWMFEDAADRRRAQVLLRAFGITIRERARQLGYTVDMVSDLPRLFRLAGTVNGKSDPVPVEIVEQTGAFVSIEDIEGILLDGAWEQAERDIDQKKSTGDQISYGDLTLDPKAEPPWVKLELLRDLEPRFDQAWRRKRSTRTETWSSSEWDQSLSSYAAQAGWTRQEIANLIIASRSKHNDDLKLRQDYYAQTINKATAGREDAEILREAVATAVELSATPADERSETSRSDVLKRLSEAIGIEITRVIRSRSEPPVFGIETPFGNGSIGSIESIMSNRKFRVKMAELTNRIARKLKDDTWDSIAQGLLELAELEDLGVESTLEGRAETLVSLYLGAATAQELGQMDERTKSVLPVSMAPFIGRDGRTRIFATGFKIWLAEIHRESLTAQEIGTMLRAIGAEPESTHYKVQGRRTTRAVWALPVTGEVDG